MNLEAFKRIVVTELERVPPHFTRRMNNVAILTEDAPSAEVCRQEGLAPGETLLGLYHGVPATERGEGYSGVLPDTVTLYRQPLLVEAEALRAADMALDGENAIRLAIRETLWHELGHHFGMDEDSVRDREDEGTNEYR